VSHSSFSCDLFCTLSCGLVLISNANPACSCVYIWKFQFCPIHPPLGDYHGAEQCSAAGRDIYDGYPKIIFSKITRRGLGNWSAYHCAQMVGLPDDGGTVEVIWAEPVSQKKENSEQKYFSIPRPRQNFLQHGRSARSTWRCGAPTTRSRRGTTESIWYYIQQRKKETERVREYPRSRGRARERKWGCAIWPHVVTLSNMIDVPWQRTSMILVCIEK
jgi:hypothetical protein